MTRPVRPYFFTSSFILPEFMPSEPHISLGYSWGGLQGPSTGVWQLASLQANEWMHAVVCARAGAHATLAGVSSGRDDRVVLSTTCSRCQCRPGLESDGATGMSTMCVQHTQLLMFVLAAQKGAI